jgi:hypothetical protein
VKEGKGDYGFNARTEQYENLLKAGVIDPTKVTRIALENAASIAGMLLTTEAVVADKPKKEEAPHNHGAPTWAAWVINLNRQSVKINRPRLYEDGAFFSLSDVKATN